MATKTAQQAQTIARLRSAKAAAEDDKKDLKRALAAQKREFNKTAATLATVGGLSATGGAIAGSKIQDYLNANYDADSYARSVSAEVPTLSIVGAVIAVVGVGMSKDNMTRAAIGGFGGGLAGGAYLRGTDLEA